MKFILYNSTIALLLVIIGLFYYKICQLIVSNEVILPISKLFIKYTQMALFVTAGAYFVLSIAEYFSPETKGTIQLCKIILIVICATLVTACLFYISKGTKSHPFFVVYLVVYLLAVGYATFDVFLLNSSRNMNILPNAIEIKGDYKMTIPFSSIVSASVTDSIPSHLSRKEGIEFMSFKKGYFTSKEGNHYYLFLKSKSSPFILLDRKNDIPVLFNCKTPHETMLLHSEISKNMMTRILE